MLHTHKTFGEGFPLSHSANILSVKIVSSDYGYPLYVYGTIIARDSLDRKCVYIFRRDQDDCQLITSKVLLPQTHTIYQCVFSCTGTSYQSVDFLMEKFWVKLCATSINDYLWMLYLSNPYLGFVCYTWITDLVLYLFHTRMYTYLSQPANLYWIPYQIPICLRYSPYAYPWRILE